MTVTGSPWSSSAAARLVSPQPRPWPRRSTLVLVLEREAQTGGIPRHSDHLGYGVRDLRRVLTGPAYARRLSASGRLFRVPEKVLRGADSARGPVTLHLR